MLLAVAFSLALRMPPIGTSFLFFYATGMIPFILYSNIASSAANAVRSNRGLLNYLGRDARSTRCSPGACSSS